MFVWLLFIKDWKKEGGTVLKQEPESRSVGELLQSPATKTGGSRSLFTSLHNCFILYMKQKNNVTIRRENVILVFR